MDEVRPPNIHSGEIAWNVPENITFEMHLVEARSALHVHDVLSQALPNTLVTVKSHRRHPQRLTITVSGPTVEHLYAPVIAAIPFGGAFGGPDIPGPIGLDELRRQYDLETGEQTVVFAMDIVSQVNNVCGY